ncbi:copper chaperone [Streptomyces sp. NPDC001076]
MVHSESRRPAEPAIAAAVALGLAAACWAASLWLMRGMDMGLATRPGASGLFAATWTTMMAAMMLPGAAPALARHVRRSGGLRGALPFTGSYLAVWVLAGVVAYALDRPHGSAAAGVVVLAAGAYELTPVKRRFRHRCHEDAGGGLRFGLHCVGSGIGLMAMLVALDVMSPLWMSVVAVLMCAQKLLPAKIAIDVPAALAIIGLGLMIVVAPFLVPGLAPPPM